MTLEIEQFACRDDNFCVLIHDTESGQTASIDAPQEKPIADTLSKRGWTLSHILTTHWHGDHVEANEALKARGNVEIVGPAAEAEKIPGIDRTVKGGDRFKFAGHTVDVIATPGHTLGEVSYYLPDDGLVFAGDTLFAIGCGRIFEGDAAMMWKSLSRLMDLPPETIVYCGHEYTLANARFALTVDPDNAALAGRAKQIEAMRQRGEATLPTTIALELATNPFLRAADPSLRARLQMKTASDADVFAEIRRRKDNF